MHLVLQVNNQSLISSTNVTQHRLTVIVTSAQVFKSSVTQTSVLYLGVHLPSWTLLFHLVGLMKWLAQTGLKPFRMYKVTTASELTKALPWINFPNKLFIVYSLKSGKYKLRCHKSLCNFVSFFCIVGK